MKFFRLEIGGEAGDGYRVTARSPTDGEASGRFAPPWRGEDLDDLLKRLADAVTQSSAVTRRVPTEEEKVAQRFGAELFDALPGPVRQLLLRSINHADSPLAVALLAQPAEVVRLPWEYLYDPEEDNFLFLHIPLIRCLAVADTQLPWRTELPLRMLSMIGHPDGLDPELERQRLTDAMDDLTQGGQVTLDWVPDRGWRDLQERVRYGQRWNVLHFLGHGQFDPASQEGSILLEDDQGQPYRMPASRLAVLLRGRPSIRLVVLNACDTGRPSAVDPFSSTAGTLLRARIPAVVAMQFRITDRAAIEFSRSFYQAIAKRTSVLESVTAARQDVQNALPGSLEWGTPVLYLPAPESEVFAISGAVAWHPSRVATIPAPRDVNHVAFSPDNGWLALACDGRRSRLVDTASWSGPPPQRRLGANLYAVAFSPDGGWLATGGLDGMVRVWDLERDEPVLAERLPDWVSYVVFSPDGTLATACGDGGVRLWQVTPGGTQDVRPVARHRAPVRAVGFEPGGERIVTACDDHTAQIWNIHDLTQPVTTLRHQARVFDVAFSPDGQRLATACEDGSARIWDPATRTPIGEFSHEDWVLGVAFSPDGRLLATASRDRTARVWETDGSRLVTIRHADTVRRVAFSPDGLWLATASYDDTSQVWQFAREVSE